MDTHIDVPSDFQKEIALLQSVNLSLASAHKQDTALIKKLEAQVESLQEKLDQAFSQGIALSHEFMAAYEKIGIMAHVTFESSLRESGKQMEGHLNTLGSVEAEDNNDFVIRLMQTEDWGNIPARAKELLSLKWNNKRNLQRNLPLLKPRVKEEGLRRCKTRKPIKRKRY